MSRSSALFRKLVSEIENLQSVEDLVQWIEDDPPPESEIFDYKSGSEITSDADVDKKKLRQIWSKAVSGFANSGGGVLLFGIATKSGQNDREPEKPSLCYNADQTEKLLTASSKSCCDPVVRNIEIRKFTFQVPDGSPNGLLLCHVPESQNRPHKAVAAENPDYYLRLQDGFQPCPHSILRALFSSSSRAEVAIELAYQINPPTDRHEGFPTCEWEITIENIGSVSLVEPTLSILRKNEGVIESKNGFSESNLRYGWEPTKMNKPYGEFIRTFPLHPGGKNLIVSGKFEIFYNGRGEEYDRGFGAILTIQARDTEKKVFSIIEPHHNFIEYRNKVSSTPLAFSDRVKVIRHTLDFDGYISREERYQGQFPSRVRENQPSVLGFEPETSGSM